MRTSTVACPTRSSECLGPRPCPGGSEGTGPCPGGSEGTKTLPWGMRGSPSCSECPRGRGSAPGGLRGRGPCPRGSEGSLVWGSPLALPDSASLATRWRRMRTCTTAWRTRRPRATRCTRTSCARSRCPCRCVGEQGRAGQAHGWGAAPDTPTPASPLRSQPKMTEYDKRCCCLREIQQTEEKYTDTLGSIQQVRCSGPAPAMRMRGAERRHPPGALNLSPLLCISLSLLVSGPSVSLPTSSSVYLSLLLCLFIPVSIFSCILISVRQSLLLSLTF